MTVTMPNFFVVGGARCGTTSFVHYLSQHPDVFVASRKESHFFAAADLPLRFGGPPAADERASLEHLIIRDEQEYRHLFDGVRSQSAIGEASVYYIYFPDVPARLAHAVPDAKIIMLLRNPVERAYSAYKLMTRDGRETLPFEESLALEPTRRAQGFEPIWWYVELSRYAQQVERYLRVFGRERVHIILTEDLEDQPAHTLQETFRFLQVRPDIPVNASERRNTGGIPKRRHAKVLHDLIYASNPVVQMVKSLVPAAQRARWGERLMTASLERPSLSAQTRMLLWQELADDVAQLEHVLGRSLEQWSYLPTPAAAPSARTTP